MNIMTGTTKFTAAESARMVAEYAPMVKSIANSLLRRLPSSVEGDDLVQDGFVGLIGALLQATKTHAGEHFERYLSQRVRGAMLDGLRKSDHGSRRVRLEMRRVECAIHRLSHRLGRAPREGEVATELAISLPTYRKLLLDAHGYTLLSLDDFDDPDPNRHFIDWCADTRTDPLAALQRQALQLALLRAAKDFSVREEQVMSMHYMDALRAKEIGVRLGISAGRVSQIHTQAIAKLRAAILGDDDRHSLLAPRWRAS